MSDSPLDAFRDDDSWVELARAAREVPPPGSIGPFEILGEARRGGQGVVFRVRQPATHRAIALKRFHSGVLERPSTLRRFEREVEAVAALDHPGIVTLFGVEFVDGAPLLTMEWVDGLPLSTWAARLGAGRDSLELKLRVFLQVCDAVAHAHRRGVLHRDLKPSNVLVDESGRSRVLDFGLAQRLGPDGETERLGPERRLGTPGYASPEQLREGSASLDVRSDVYSLAVVLFELLTGALPFSEEGGEAGDAQREVPATGLHTDLDAITAKGLARDPDRRYQSVEALAEDLRRHLEHRPLAAVTPSAFASARKWVRRNRALAAAGALVLVVAGAFVVQTLRQSAAVARERDLARAAQARAEGAREEAESVLRFFLYTLTDSFGMGEPGESETVGEALQRTLATVTDRFGEHPEIEAEIRAVGGRALWMAGRSDQARATLVAALADFDARGLEVLRSRAAAEMTIAQIDMEAGRLKPALEGAERALRVLDRSEGAWPARQAIARLLRSEVLFRLRRYPEAVASCRETLATLERAGLEPLGSTNVETRILLSAALAPVEAEEGRRVLEELVRDTESLYDAHSPEAARLWVELARVQRDAGEGEAALELLRRAGEVFEATLQADDPVRSHQQLLMGETLRELGRYEEALAWFERACHSPMDVLRAQALSGLFSCSDLAGRPGAAAPMWEAEVAHSISRWGPLSEEALDAELTLLTLLARADRLEAAADRLGPLLDRLPLAAEAGYCPTGSALAALHDVAERTWMGAAPVEATFRLLLQILDERSAARPERFLALQGRAGR